MSPEFPPYKVYEYGTMKLLAKCRNEDEALIFAAIASEGTDDVPSSHLFVYECTENQEKPVYFFMSGIEFRRIDE